MTSRARRLLDRSSGLLGTKAVFLGSYALLVVLPTIVFGGLHGHQLWSDYRERMRELPHRSQTLALQMLALVGEKIRGLIDTEELRDWTHYRSEYYVPGTTRKEGRPEIPFVPSELEQDERPEGIQAWYTYLFKDGVDAKIQFFGGSTAQGEEWDAETDRLARLLKRVIREDENAPQEQELARLRGGRELKVPSLVVGVNLSMERDPECLRLGFEELGELAQREVPVEVWKFHLRLLREDDGQLRLLATRRVQIFPGPGFDPSKLPDCFAENGFDTTLVQGFFIDPDWFFRRVPQAVARLLLDETEHLYFPEEQVAHGMQDEVAAFDLNADYDIEAQYPEDASLGQLRVAIDRSALVDGFKSTAAKFVGVAAMMIVSLSTGMWLLVRSVQQSLAEARRTENFVAAVSHELRTPLAAVKMYGEMLQDGWVQDRAKQADYLERILRETNRLDALVDRVLEKRRLAAQPPEPAIGDLADVVRERIPDLLLTAGTYGTDVAFEIEPGLPPVRLIPESVQAILANLVENARKYAPVDPAAPGAEPILVCVRKLGRRVVLEVLDRGPGIPEAERTRIFQAFYRIGDERTRRTPGTGLGLHLVWLQAKAMGARVQALPREGGGANFRVSFRTHRESARSSVPERSPPVTES
jgi:signal transduction histidine kinase